MLELIAEEANFLIDVLESPEDFEAFFNTLVTRQSRTKVMHALSSRKVMYVQEFAKMIKKQLESLRELDSARRKEGAEKLRRLIESRRLQAYEAIEDACMQFISTQRVIAEVRIK